MIITPSQDLINDVGEQSFTAGKHYHTLADVRTIHSEVSVKDDQGEYHRLGAWFTKFSEVTTYRVTHFPMEDKYSIWDNNHNLVKEWFDTREEAQTYIDENL